MSVDDGGDDDDDDDGDNDRVYFASRLSYTCLGATSKFRSETVLTHAGAGGRRTRPPPFLLQLLKDGR